MYVSKIKTRYRRIRKSRLCQGDILRDIQLIIGMDDSENHTVIDLPYSVIMNQDCDLQNDFDERNENSVTQDKYLKTVLLCPAYQSEKFFLGQHVELRMKSQTDREVLKIKANDQMKRYHYLKGDNSLSIPDLVLDFKHFYTAPRDLLYKKRKDLYLGTINELFREELSQRFAYFLSRIGLPEI